MMDFNLGNKPGTIRKDAKVIVVSLLVALIFWIVQKFSQTYTSNLTVQIKYEMPETVTFSQEPIRTAEYMISATGWDLVKLQWFADLNTISIPLNDAAVQTLSGYTLREKIKSILASYPVNVLNVSPDIVQIHLEQAFRKTVPVKFNYSIKFYPDYELNGDIILEPDSILVFGPQSYLDTIQFWPTEQINLTNVRESVQTAIKLQSPTQSFVRLGTEKVQVNITVEQYTEKELEVPIQFSSNKKGNTSFKFIPEMARVFVVVPLSRYDGLEAEAFKVVADEKAQTLKNETYILPLKVVEKPDYVRNIVIHPKTVELFYIK